MRDHFRTARNLRAVTLMEVLVALIIIGVIAGLAIPKFTRSVAITKERRALNNLYSIHAAQLTYRKANNVYWPPAGPTQPLADINTNLVLNILADGDTYTCNPDLTPGSGYECFAQFDNNSYTLKVTEDATAENVNPCCSAGSCPLTSACP